VKGLINKSITLFSSVTAFYSETIIDKCESVDFGYFVTKDHKHDLTKILPFNLINLIGIVEILARNVSVYI
jgi:hypothetical protein